MTAIEAIETRRSVREFDPNHRLTEMEISQLISLAKLAPTSFNMQNYRFVVVSDPALRKKIRTVAWDQPQITDASLLLILCGDLNSHLKNPARYWSHAPQSVQELLVPELTSFYDGKHQLIRDEAMRSTAFAGITFMLAARELGYDSCPMVGFDSQEVAKLIHLPSDHVLSFIVAIGKLAKPVWPRGDRLPDDEIVIDNCFPEHEQGPCHDP